MRLEFAAIVLLIAVASVASAKGVPTYTIEKGVALTHVRGEVNQEDVGEMQPGMKAKLQLVPYRTRTFIAHVTSIQHRSRPSHPALYCRSGDRKSAQQLDGWNDR